MILSSNIKIEGDIAVLKKNPIIQLLKKHFMLDNPEFITALKLKLNVIGLDPKIKFYEESTDGISFPRGGLSHIVRVFDEHKKKYTIKDMRFSSPPIEFKFKKTLKPFQERAVGKILSSPFGTIASPTGSGKTVMAIYSIAARRQKTLILTHTKNLARQWRSRILDFLDIEENEITMTGDGKKNVSGKIIIGTIQTVYNFKDELNTWGIGHLIADECHRVPAKTFCETIAASNSFYMLGLSATPYRRDKMDQAIYWHIGPIKVEIPIHELIASGDIVKPEYKTHETKYITALDPTTQYTTMINELLSDGERNMQIILDVMKEYQSGKKCIILSDRVEHCNEMSDILLTIGISSTLVTSKQKDPDTNIAKILIATSQLIGEGFDDQNLEALFLTTPIKFSGRFIQYIGRIIRTNKNANKRPVIHDYVDRNIPLLAHSARQRLQVIEAMFKGT